MNEKQFKYALCFLFLLAAIAYALLDLRGRWEQFQLIFTGICVVSGIILFSIRDKELIRVTLILMGLFVGVRFVIWRTCSALNLTSPLNALVSFALLFAESYAVFIFFLVSVQNWTLKRRAKPVSDPAFSPSVDVFIVTYNEPLEILRRTVCGAKYIDYPNKKVYILDDGRRNSIMQLALDLDIGYITRPDNRHAKAGNINNALKQTSGEFILILDADHIPCRTILHTTVPFFKDEKVAIVQTPHRFMNAAPIQRNLRLEGRLPHEQEMFFQISMVGRDAWNAAIFAGSAGVIRRSTMEEVGGMSIGTVIEDCEFSLDLHSRGYKSVYIPEPESIGMCPETLAAYLVQQSRWARGQTQMLVMANPLLARGLTLAQRICYLSGNLHYLYGIPRLIYILVPVGFLLFGLCATSISWPFYTVMSFPFLFTYLLSQSYTFRNFRHSFWSDVYEVVLAPFTAYWTTLTLIDPKVPVFAVTPKGIKTKRLFFDFRVVWPNFLILVICIFAFIVGLIKVSLMFDPMGMFVNLIWDGYNIIILVCAVFVGLERPQTRRVPRVRRNIPVTVRSTNLFEGSLGGRSQDVSEYGARIITQTPPAKIESGQILLVSFETDEGELLDIPAKVVRAHPEKQDFMLTVEFEQPELATLYRLITAFYCSPNMWAILTEPRDSIFRSLSEILTTPIRVMEVTRRIALRTRLSILVPSKVFSSKLIPKKLAPYLVDAGQSSATAQLIGSLSDATPDKSERTQELIKELNEGQRQETDS